MCAQRRTAILLAGLAAAVALLPCTTALAGKLYYHRGHPRVCCCVPQHRYGHDTPRDRAIVLASAAQTVAGQVRTFFPATRSAAAGPVNLTDLGLAIWPDGRLLASARLSHDGGPAGELQGSHVRVQVRAWINPNGANEPLSDPILIAHREHRVWVSRGASEVVSLLPDSDGGNRLLSMHFMEITHVEVQMEALQDR